MAQTLTFTIKFNIDPPNVQQALDAVNTSLKNVGISITNIEESTPKINALDDSFTKIGLRLQGIQNLFNIVTSSFGSIVAASNTALGYRVAGNQVVGERLPPLEVTSVAPSGTQTEGGYGFASKQEFDEFLEYVDGLRLDIQALLGVLTSHGLVATE